MYNHHLARFTWVCLFFLLPQRHLGAMPVRAGYGQPLLPGVGVARLDGPEVLHEPDGGVRRFGEGELFCIDS